MSDWIDKRIFLENYNGILESEFLAEELRLVASAILRENGNYNKHPSLPKEQIQKLKQVVWILEANNKN